MRLTGIAFLCCVSVSFPALADLPKPTGDSIVSPLTPSSSRSSSGSGTDQRGTDGRPHAGP